MRVTSFYFVLLLPSYICKLIQGHFCYLFFFFNATATTEIYTLSLHDALPISRRQSRRGQARIKCSAGEEGSDGHSGARGDRKSTRLNSSNTVISYAVFCLKKKKTTRSCCTRSCITQSSRGPGRRLHGRSAIST